MQQIEISSWHTVIETTLDTDYMTIKIPNSKAQLLQKGLSQGGYYLLTLEAGFDMEIVKVLKAAEGLLTVDRAQQGTLACVWPAGTLIEARITAKTLDELHLDLNSLVSLNNEVLLAPNGDLITKPAFIDPTH